MAAWRAMSVGGCGASEACEAVASGPSLQRSLASESPTTAAPCQHHTATGGTARPPWASAAAGGTWSPVTEGHRHLSQRDMVTCYTGTWSPATEVHRHPLQRETVTCHRGTPSYLLCIYSGRTFIKGRSSPA